MSISSHCDNCTGPRVSYVNIHTGFYCEDDVLDSKPGVDTVAGITAKTPAGVTPLQYAQILARDLLLQIEREKDVPARSDGSCARCWLPIYPLVDTCNGTFVTPLR